MSSHHSSKKRSNARRRRGSYQRNKEGGRVHEDQIYRKLEASLGLSVEKGAEVLGSFAKIEDGKETGFRLIIQEPDGTVEIRRPTGKERF